MGRKTLANRIDLGMTRIAGYTLFDEETKEFHEITPKEVKDLIKQGQVNGLKLVNGEIELDTEGFNIKNMMIKSGVGKYRTLYPTTSIVNCMYAVVRVIETDKGILYEVINNKCGRIKITPDRLKVLLELGCVAGVKMGTDGEIEICKGVTIQDKRTKVEQFDNITQTDAKEHEQGLQSGYIEIETVSTAEGNEQAAEKSAESLIDDSPTPVEHADNGLEIAFDSIDVPEVHADANVISNDTSMNLDNAEINDGNYHPKGQVEDKKTTTPRRNKGK